MITANVIHRTFHIRSGNSLGTAFAIDHNGKQYLVTARHVVEGISADDEIEMFHEQQWKRIAARVVGIGDGEIDAAVLSCPIHLAPPWPLEPSADGLTYGQQVYFLGYPFGLVGGLERVNRNFPVPFVKGGIYSATDETRSVIYVDGHGNPGFSGGLMVFRPSGQSSKDFQVAGIASHIPPTPLEPIVDGEGTPIVAQNNRPIAYTQENPGFVIVYEIKNATKLIDANPIGFKLPIEQES